MRGLKQLIAVLLYVNTGSYFANPVKWKHRPPESLFHYISIIVPYRAR